MRGACNQLRRDVGVRACGRGCGWVGRCTASAGVMGAREQHCRSHERHDGHQPLPAAHAPHHLHASPGVANGARRRGTPTARHADGTARRRHGTPTARHADGASQRGTPTEHAVGARRRSRPTGHADGSRRRITPTKHADEAWRGRHERLAGDAPRRIAPLQADGAEGTGEYSEYPLGRRSGADQCGG
jgi:hypothetical protein